jgi:hypothetical protein
MEKKIEKHEYIGRTITGKVAWAEYRKKGNWLRIKLCEEDRKKFDREEIVLRFLYPPVLPILVGDEITAFVRKDFYSDEFDTMHEEEKPYSIEKIGEPIGTFFDTED